MRTNESNKAVVLSCLNHTWFVDLDGTILKHNGYKIDGFDTLLDGAKEFMERIPANDLIIIITSRTNEFRKITDDFLNQNGIYYDHIIYNAPYGERILINDRKPSGLAMAVSINVDRDKFIIPEIIEFDEEEENNEINNEQHE
jgi:hypothetical protein